MAQTAPKKYGLIVPKKSKVAAVVKKPSVFDDSSSDEEVSGKVKGKISLGSLWRENKKNYTKMESQGAVAKALEEDPEVFDYDGQYDKIQEQKRKTNTRLAQRDKSSKYISKLKKVADRRKLEQDIIYERKVQREMEREGLEHEDKDTFLTSAYRRKLEERRQLEAELKMAAMKEAADDITKQADLSRIHRTLLHRMTGGQKEELATKDGGEGREEEGGVRVGGAETESSPAEDRSPQQGDTSGQQVETSGQQVETSGQQEETSGQQVETSGQQEETLGQQAETSGQQEETSGPQTEAPVESADEALFPPTVDKAKMRKIAATKRTNEESLGSAKERYLARKRAKLTAPVISDD